MAQLAGDEKNDVDVKHQPGALEAKANGNMDEKQRKYPEIYTCTTEIHKDKNELKLEIQNKQTKQLFKGIYTLDKLTDCGFHKQQSLQDIETILQSAFDNKEGLTLDIR